MLLLRKSREGMCLPAVSASQVRHVAALARLSWDERSAPKLVDELNEILAYITQYAQDRGYAPTLQEIGARFGLSSVATVHKHVAHLVDKGFLKRERRNASRDIAVVGDDAGAGDRKSTRLNSSHRCISYAVFCL